jgi:hypothetical protein
VLVRPPLLALAASAVAGGALASPGTAAAASYAGGGLTPAAPLVSARVADSGAVEVAGQAIARCARGAAVDEHLVVRGTLRPGGAFVGTATRNYRVSVREWRLVKVTATGLFAGPRAVGNLRVVVRVRRGRGTPTVTCDSATQRWEARVVPVPAGTPSAPVAGAYYGATTQGGRYLPFPLVLRVAPGATRIDAALYRLRRRCQGATSDDFANNSPGAPIRPDGTFNVVQRYSQRFPDSVEHFTFTFAGRFTTAGAAGAVRGTSVLRDVRDRRIVGRCDTGPVFWTAAR